MNATPGTDYAAAVHQWFRGERKRPTAGEFGIDADLADVIFLQCQASKPKKQLCPLCRGMGERIHDTYRGEWVKCERCKGAKWV